MLWEVIKGALVGGIIGWVTNQLAVWMLFHPKKPIRIGGSHVPLTPGLVVKNQERLAEAIGRAVSRDLLDQETLKDHLRQLNLEPALRNVLLAERDHLRDIEQPIAEKIGEEHLPALDEFKRRAARAIAARAGAFAGRLESDLHTIQHVLESLLDGLFAIPISELVPVERRLKVQEDLLTKLGNWSASEEGKDTLRKVIDAGVTGFASSNSLSTGIQGSLSSYIDDQVPSAIDAILRSLRNYLRSKGFEELVRPKAQSKLLEIVVSRFPMATMFLNEQIVEELFTEKWDVIVSEIEKIAESEKLRGFMNDQIRDAANSIAGSAGTILSDGENSSKIANWISGQIGDSASEVLAKDEVTAVINSWFTGLGEKCLADILGKADSIAADLAPRAANLIGDWLRSDVGLSWVEDRADEVLDDVFYREPISGLAELLPDDEAVQVASALAIVLQERALRALPEILVDQVDLQGIVTEKVKQFDSDQIEETILRVSGRELKGIVRLGGIIGILVGASSPLLDVIAGWLR